MLAELRCVCGGLKLLSLSRRLVLSFFCDILPPLRRFVQALTSFVTTVF